MSTVSRSSRELDVQAAPSLFRPTPAACRLSSPPHFYYLLRHVAARWWRIFPPFFPLFLSLFICSPSPRFSPQNLLQNFYKTSTNSTKLYETLRNRFYLAGRRTERFPRIPQGSGVLLLHILLHYSCRWILPLLLSQIFILINGSLRNCVLFCQLHSLSEGSAEPGLIRRIQGVSLGYDCVLVFGWTYRHCQQELKKRDK